MLPIVRHDAGLRKGAHVTRAFRGIKVYSQHAILGEGHAARKGRRELGQREVQGARTEGRGRGLSAQRRGGVKIVGHAGGAAGGGGKGKGAGCAGFVCGLVHIGVRGAGKGGSGESLCLGASEGKELHGEGAVAGALEGGGGGG